MYVCMYVLALFNDGKTWLQSNLPQAVCVCMYNICMCVYVCVYVVREQRCRIDCNNHTESLYRALLSKSLHMQSCIHFLLV